MADPIIKVENLSFTYQGDKKALKNINLEIAEGEYVAIVGANGAGKTTLCLLLNGIIPNVIGGRIAGTVHVNHLNTFDHHVYEIAQTVGLVLQDPESQLFSADVCSEIAFAAENRGIPRGDIITRLNEAISIVRLNGLEDRLSDELSGGQKQRLAIAANLVVRPKIMVADEPTSQLDPVGKEEVFATLAELNEKHGMTVIIASHDVDEISRYADRVIVLNEGEIVLQGTPDKVFHEIEVLDRVFVHVPDIARLGKLIGINHRQPIDLHIDKASAQIHAWLAQQKGKTTHLVEFPSTAPVQSVKPEEMKTSGVVAVKVENLSYIYPGTTNPALQDIQCEISQGEFVGVIGQNGAGKTTLMKCLVGLHKPTSGKVFINGKPIMGQKVGEVARQIGLILQNPDTQLFTMSVEEEIRFGLTSLKLAESEIAARTDEALEITGLERYRHLYPFKLSLGDRRKVAVASIVAMRPSILIFDEPLTGQDYKGRYELTNLAAKLHQAGHTVIMISHDMELVAQYTQRTIVLGQSKVLLDAPTRKVFDYVDILRSTYIEPPEIIQLAQSLRPDGLPDGLLTVEDTAKGLVDLANKKS
jgi:energy-coupling factor transporter ATP-binding protein EcfA2